MTVTITKPSFNLRDALVSLKRKIGIKGAELMAAETADDVYRVINPAGFKNLLINGDMRVAQRGTSSTTDNNYATVDRWFKYSGGDTTTWGQAEDAVHGKYAYWSANTSGYGNLRQRIEGIHVPSGGLPMVFSCWMRVSAGSAPFRIEIWNLTDNTDILSNMNVTTITTSWQQVVVPFTLPASANNDVFHIMVGSNSAPSQVVFNMTKCQLERGTVATPFEHRLYGTELALCQRYLTVFGTPANNQYVHLGIATLYTATAINLAVALPVSMRTTPSLTTVLNGSSVWLQTYIGASGINSNAIVATGEYLSVGSNTIRLYCTGAYSGGTVGQSAWCQVMNGAQLQFLSEL